jgi:hypothetical protein
MGCNTLSNPYYVSACGIQEPQTLNVYNYFFSSVLLTAEAWVVPACDEYATIKMGNLAVVPVGAYIWNSLYGFFKIISYNQETCVLTVQNECQFNNAAAGTAVPACTAFVLTPCYCFCEEPAVEEGSLRVCYDGGVVTLSGASTDLIPVLTNVDTEYVEFLDPNDAYAMRCCSWDLSARVMRFNEEYEYTRDTEVELTTPGATSSVSDYVTIENDVCKDLVLFFAITSHINGELEVTAGDYANWKHYIQILDITNIDTVMINEQHLEQSYARTATVNHAFKLAGYGVDTISAYSSITYRFWTQFQYSAGNITGYTIPPGERGQRLKVTVFGVAA